MLGFTDEGTIRNGFSAEQEIRMLEADQKELAVTFASLGLSIAGLITGFGEAADAANAALFYSTGHPILGTLSGLSALPIPVIEQALGLTVGACLLVKVVWIGGKIIKNAVVIASKTKLAKPFFMMCQKTGRFFQCTYEKGKAIIKTIQYELTHNSMKPGYVNLGGEIKGFECKTLIQNITEAFKKIAKWFSARWNSIKTTPITKQNVVNTQTKKQSEKINSIFNYNAQSTYNKDFNRYIKETRTNPNSGWYYPKPGGNGGMKI